MSAGTTDSPNSQTERVPLNRALGRLDRRGERIWSVTENRGAGSYYKVGDSLAAHYPDADGLVEVLLGVTDHNDIVMLLREVIDVQQKVIQRLLATWRPNNALDWFQWGVIQVGKEHHARVVAWDRMTQAERAVIDVASDG